MSIRIYSMRRSRSRVSSRYHGRLMNKMEFSQLIRRTRWRRRSRGQRNTASPGHENTSTVVHQSRALALWRGRGGADVTTYLNRRGCIHINRQPLDRSSAIRTLDKVYKDVYYGGRPQPEMQYRVILCVKPVVALGFAQADKAWVRKVATVPGRPRI